MKSGFPIKKRISAAVFGAALSMILTAQNTASPYLHAEAMSLTEEEGETAVGSELLSDSFGEIVLHRWEKMTDDNYPKDNEPHPVLIFWGSNADKVMNPVAPSDIYLESSHPVIEGAKWFGRDGNGDYPLSKYNRAGNDHYPNNNINPYGAAALKLHDTANYSELKHNLNEDVFYTKSDYNCMYAQYRGIESETNCPYFTLRLSNGRGGVSDYVVNLPTSPPAPEHSSGLQEVGQLKITRGNDRAKGYEDIVFQQDSDKKFHILDANETDNDVYMVSQDGFAIAEAKYEHYAGGANGQFTADAETAEIFFGESYRFSAILEDTTVSSGQILSVGKTDYLDTAGDVRSQDGVMLPAGTTITVNKGGILSVSGEFINNGTIINNGGVILVKEGGTIYPWRTGSVPSRNGCGTIKCLGGDIIIKEGGAVYAGLNDESGNIVPFQLDNGSTLINRGLLVYGSVSMGEGAKFECYGSSKTYGSWYMKPASSSWKSSIEVISATNDYYGNVRTPEAFKARFEELGVVVLSAEDVEGKACRLVMYTPHATDQTEKLTKLNNSLMSGDTSKASGILTPLAIGSGVNAGMIMNGGNTLGLWIANDVSDKQRPYILKTGSAVINDMFIGRIEVGDLTI